MEHYNLQQDEVVLYKGAVSCKERRGAIDLALTNFNFVFIIKTKKLLSKEQVEVLTYPIDAVKKYKEQPQVKATAETVEIYFTNAEYTLVFPDKKEAKKFVSKALDIITGKNAFVRGVDKAKATVAMVDETLGIDSVGLATTAVKVATPKVVGLFSKRKAVKEVVSITGGATGKTKQITSVQLSPEEQANALEHFKKLKDDGAITQEEYDKKKKEIMGL